MNIFEKLFINSRENGIPYHLYKYRSLERLVEYLEHEAAYFPSRRELNDSFEGTFILKDINSKDDWNSLCNRVGLTNDESKAIYNHVENDGLISRIETEIAVNKVFDKIGILSMSESYLDEAMWGYYADGGRGACIEFDTRKDTEFFDFVRKVEYVDKKYILDALKESPNRVKPLLTKSKKWKNEKEYRVLKHICNQEIKFKKEAITSIVLGDRVTREQTEMIKQLAFNKGYNNINFKQLVRAKNNYEYIVTELL